MIVIATSRSDALPSFQSHLESLRIDWEPWHVGQIPHQKLSEVIEGPAKLYDIPIQTGFVQRLVQDATTGDALPLVAFALRYLYDRYGPEQCLQINSYEVMGRLEGLVQRKAEDAVASKNPTEVELSALRSAFIPRLVRITGDGHVEPQSARWDDLPEDAHRLLDVLINERLIVSDGDGPTRSVEIAHEALIRTWKRISDWLTEDHKRLLVASEIENAGAHWEKNEKSNAWLIHRGDRLIEAEQVLAVPRFLTGVSHRGHEYLRACQEQRQREDDRSKSERNRTLAAQSKALSHVSRAHTENGFATLAALLAIEALPNEFEDRPYVQSAEAALIYAFLQRRESKVLIGHTGEVNKVSFSPDGSTLLTAGSDGIVCLWNLVTGLHTALGCNDGPIHDATFSPDGTLVAAALCNGTVNVWDARTTQRIRTLRGHEAAINQVLFSPNANVIATASADCTVKLWSSATGILLATCRGHTKEILSVQFSSSGAFLVTASADASARIWCARLNQDSIAATATLDHHSDAVLYATFSPDEKSVLTCSWDKTSFLWDYFSRSARTALAMLTPAVTCRSPMLV